MISPENKERISTADILSSIEEGVITPLEAAYAIRKAAEKLHSQSAQLLYRSEEVSEKLPVFSHIIAYDRFMDEMSGHYSEGALNRAWNAVVRKNNWPKWALDSGDFDHAVIAKGDSFDPRIPMLNLSVVADLIDDVLINNLGVQGKEIFKTAKRIADENDRARMLAEDID